MDRGQYRERRNELKWRRRLAFIPGLIACLTVAGIPLGLWLFKKADNAKDELKELEREYEEYVDSKGQASTA